MYNSVLRFLLPYAFLIHCIQHTLTFVALGPLQVHLEGMQLLGFTEQEFVRTLDWNL